MVYVRLPLISYGHAIDSLNFASIIHKMPLNVLEILRRGMQNTIECASLIAEHGSHQINGQES